jgi:hypothetical protein
MDPVPLLEFSSKLGPNNKPLWERPRVVCTEEVCGPPGKQPEAGVDQCLQHTANRRYCILWVLERQEAEKEIIEQNARRRKMTDQMSEVAERTAGWVSPPDRFSFRGNYVKEVGAGLPSLGKDQ